MSTATSCLGSVTPATAFSGRDSQAEPLALLRKDRQHHQDQQRRQRAEHGCFSTQTMLVDRQPDQTPGQADQGLGRQRAMAFH